MAENPPDTRMTLLARDTKMEKVILKFLLRSCVYLFRPFLMYNIQFTCGGSRVRGIPSLFFFALEHPSTRGCARNG